jgi:hypothetical protein
MNERNMDLKRDDGHSMRRLQRGALFFLWLWRAGGGIWRCVVDRRCNSNACHENQDFDSKNWVKRKELIHFAPFQRKDLISVDQMQEAKQARVFQLIFHYSTTHAKVIENNLLQIQISC